MLAVAVGSSGSHRVDGAELKSALGWYDERVWIKTSDHTIRGAIRERYDSLGCAPGLPTSPQHGVHEVFARSSPAEASTATRTPA